MNFSGNTREVLSSFQYDNSNRLLRVVNTPKFYSPLEYFSYDKDGNLQTLTRDYSGDNFSSVILFGQLCRDASTGGLNTYDC